MKYLSGIFALNLMCDLDTFGDWHTSAINWKNIRFWESDESIWKDYGIEKDRTIPLNDGKFNIANHIRALLDLISVGDFPTAYGMRDDFICNDKYTLEIFDKVSMLKEQQNWNDIDRFMNKEYMMQWINYKKEIGLYREPATPFKSKYVDVAIAKAHSIDDLCRIKCIAYMGRDTIQDLHDLCYISEKHFDKLSSGIKSMLQNALEYKGLEYFCYIIQTQKDPLIDNNALAESFFKLYDKLGLIYDTEEKQKILSVLRKSIAYTHDDKISNLSK